MGALPLAHQKAVLFKHGYDLFKVSVHALATAVRCGGRWARPSPYCCATASINMQTTSFASRANSSMEGASTTKPFRSGLVAEIDLSFFIV